MRSWIVCIERHETLGYYAQVWRHCTSGKFKARYENDGTSLLNAFPGDIGHFGDTQDRFRTAGLEFGWGNYKLGFKLFTGDPVDYQQATPKGTNGFPTGWYTNPSADKYRAGIFYIGYGSFKVGVNNEGVRDYIQNQTIHRFFGNPYFLVNPNSPKNLFISNSRESLFHGW